MRSTRHLVLALAAGALGIGLAAPASAGVPQSVSVKDNFFDPDVTNQGVGLSVTWEWDDGIGAPHNVRQDSKLFYSGAPTNNTAETFALSEPSAGKFHYYCEPHGSASGGMDGVLRMRPSWVPIDSDKFRVLWGGNLETGDQFDVRFRVGNGDWKPWKTDTGKASGVFGKRNRPVDVKPGKTYSFKARSERSSNPRKRSGFSPALSVSP